MKKEIENKTIETTVVAFDPIVLYHVMMHQCPDKMGC